MMRYLKDAAETIARDPDRENALALRLAELHFAERMVVSCPELFDRDPDTDVVRLKSEKKK
jgi:hypothetical protein